MSLAEDELVESLCGSFQHKESGDKIARDSWRQWLQELKTRNQSLAKRIAGVKNIEEADAFLASYLKGEERPKKSPDEKRREEFELANALMVEFPFLTTEDSGELWTYGDGLWKPRGEILVEGKVEGLFQEDATVHRSNEVLGHVRRATFTDRQVFNSRDDLVNVENGVIDLSHNPPTLLDHDPDHHFTWKLPVEFNPDAECPNIERFSCQVLHDDDVEAIYEVIGYCLMPGYRFRKGFMFLGDGHNGKSTWIEVIRSMLGGENCSSVSLQTLLEVRFASAELFGKLANLCADIPSKSLRETGMFKMLTGGDEIPAERKFRDQFSFKNRAKLIFSCNQLPQSYDYTSAFFGRWNIFNFPYAFVGEGDDKDLLAKLTTEEELSGLLNLALEGMGRLQKNGAFSNEKSIDEVMEDYTRRSDSVGAFAMDRIDADPESEVQKDVVYNEYVAYCRGHKLPVVYNNVFTKGLKRQGLHLEDVRHRKGGKYVRFWKGIKLREEPEDENGPDPRGEGGKVRL